MIRGLEPICWEERLGELGLVSWGCSEKALGRPYCGLPVLKGACKRAGEGLLTRSCSDRTRGNGFKLKEGRYRLDIRKKFLSGEVLAQAA